MENTTILSNHTKTLLQKENLTMPQISSIYLELVKTQQGGIAYILEPACLGPYHGSATNYLCKLGQIS